MARLLYNDRSGRQQVLELDPGRRQVVLGRQSDCDIIVHDTSVSRRHCIIAPEDSGFVVVDLGSANGTLVNDVRVTRRRLADNDVIRCGIYAVRFIETADAVDPARMNLRDRYRKRSEGAGRAAIERLQALNEHQAQRLVQLQDELARLGGGWNEGAERSTRPDGELLAAREQLHEMQAHLRHLATALQHRESELAALRGGSPGPLSAPPVPPPPDVEPGLPMADAALASANQALRVEIAQLETALATEDAFTRSSGIVPAVDRWRAIDAHRQAAREAQANADRLRHALQEAEARGGGPAAPGVGAGVSSRIVELEAAVRVAERARRSAEARALAAEAKLKSKARPPLLMPSAVDSGGIGASRASVFGRVGSTKTGLLSGLGGLGRTADDGREREPAAQPLTERLTSRGRQAALNRDADDRSRKNESIRDLQAMVDRLTEQRTTARESSRVLVERFAALRAGDGVPGLPALQVAEYLDLAETIRNALEDEAEP